jgi:putative protease
MVKMKKPELLSPAGNFASLTSAINNGADAVYFGLKDLNLRKGADNFELKDLKMISEYCHKNKVKCYLTLNTIMFDDDLKNAEKIIKEAKKAKIDAIICWDFSVIELCRKYKMNVHLSTQASTANINAIRFLEKFNVKRINLARELSLEQIKKIRKQTKTEIECFVHGAMCVSVSGRCLLSQSLFNKSANRGECLQPCRREFTIKDKELGFELDLGKNYVLSPKDLCVLPFLDRLIEAKIDAFKIEGRNRSPEYVALVTKVYRKAIDAYFDKKFSKELADSLLKELKKVYNRDFSSGFYLGLPDEKDFTDAYGSKASERKEYLGYVMNYFKNVNAAEVKIETKELKVGDVVWIIGNKTGSLREMIVSMEINHKKISSAKKGQSVAVKLKNIVRPNDKIYLIVKN